jgi:hypothetical protein
MTMIAILAAMSALTADEIPVELPQSPDRPSIASSELKGLRENNIFSPHRTKPFEPRRSETTRPEPRPAAPSKPKPLLVTGLFADPVTGVPKAIVEDRNDERHRHLKEPKFCVGGEEFLGLKIEAVTADHVVVTRGDVRKECKVGDALPEGDVPAVAPSSSSTSESTSAPAPALEEGTKNDILEALRARNKRKRDEP